MLDKDFLNNRLPGLISNEIDYEKAFIQMGITGSLKEPEGWSPFPMKVIFKNPATIVIWNDHTKTVVKCSKPDIYDRAKGLALCYMKKACGNNSRFNDYLQAFGAYENDEEMAVHKKKHKI